MSCLLFFYVNTIAELGQLGVTHEGCSAISPSTPPLPPLSEWPPPLKQPRRSIGTLALVPITSFEPLPKAELSSLPSIHWGHGGLHHALHDTIQGFSRRYRGRGVHHTVATFDVASPNADHDSASHSKDSNPPLPLLKEWPPLEQPQRSIGTATLVTSSEPLPGLSSLPILPIADGGDYSPLLDKF